MSNTIRIPDKRMKLIISVIMIISVFWATESRAQVVQDTVIQNLLGQVSIDTLMR